MQSQSIGNLAEITVGYQAREKIAVDPHGSHRLIQGRDFLYPNRFLTTDLLSFSPDPPADACLVRPGDILFQARGTEHLACCFEEDLENVVASASFYIIRPKQAEALLPAYLAWWINQPPAQRFLETASQSSSIGFVPKSLFAKLPVEVPSRRLQENIVKATALWRREAEIRSRIAELRAALVARSCMAALQDHGDS